MFSFLSKVPQYYLFRLTGKKSILPMNLTLSVSYKCNSRCKTCNIYNRKAEELSIEEWEAIFQNYGKGMTWVTMSGGEPFLRKDFTEIVCMMYDICQPSIINIPTNGILKDQIPENVEKIAFHCKDAKIVINISLDEIEAKHDFIRGVKGNYSKALETFSGLKNLGASNLSVGIHTVISKYNVERIPQIYGELIKLNPDSYITEIAEERVELGTIGSAITPEYTDYVRAVDFLVKELENLPLKKIGKITKAFRLQYYEMVKRLLKEKKQQIPCYSGFASAQIAPDGDVWMCCIKAEPVGNLRNVGYDFRKIWVSEKASALREKIKNGECYCPLANAAYTNMLHDIKSLLKVGWNYLRMR